jgi:DNA polymerase-3 subunit alpha
MSSKLDINNVSFEDSKTWKLIQKGHTSGVFQLESDLGKQWVSKIKPRNINELSAVLALLRPACLDSGMTQQYYLIKSGQEPPLKFQDPKIDSILEYTKGVLIFQEQLMKFGSEIAWTDLPHIEKLVTVDKLRKGIGKKDSKLIANLRNSFIEGCIRNGWSSEIAHQLFELIENAGRYAFNDAHAKKYALWSYRTAYLKANFPHQFYCVYMTYSKMKQKPREELYNLINEARMLNVTIFPPMVTYKNSEFQISNIKGTDGIVYGLSHIKQVSLGDIKIINQHDIETFQKLINLLINPDLEKRIRIQTLVGLIQSGSCDVYGISRVSMLGLIDIIKNLSVKEKKYLSLHIDSCVDYKEVKNILWTISNDVSIKKRKELVQSEVSMWDTESKDNLEQNLVLENQLLGIEISTQEDIVLGKRRMSCKSCFSNYQNSKNKKGFLVSRIKEIREIITKRGRNKGSKMAQLTLSDSTGSIKVACFAEVYGGLKDLLEENRIYEFQLNGTGSGWCIKSASISKKE